MIIRYGSISDTGLVRNCNQDCIFAEERVGCGIFMVADGMGGHSRGELASALAAEVTEDWWKRNYTRISKASKEEIENMLIQFVEAMNKRIYEMYEKIQLRGGTTLVLLIVNEKNYGIATVGDSRIYQLRENRISQLSVDDVWENLPENRGISEEKIMSDYRYGTLTQALGYDKEVNPDIRIFPVDMDMTFLLCSDGAYKYLTEKKIIKMLLKTKKEKNLSKIMEKMKKDVYKAGAGDNLSGIVVKTEYCTTV